MDVTALDRWADDLASETRWLRALLEDAERRLAAARRELYATLRRPARPTPA